MKRALVVGSLAVVFMLPLLALLAQEKTKTEPQKTESKTTEPKTTEPKTSSKTEAKTTEPKKTEKAKAPGKPEMRIEVVQLYNPTGVAVQTGTGDVFIADSGNLRVLRYALRPKPDITDEIVGFSED